MKRFNLIVIALASVMMSPAVFAAQPFGSFGGIVGNGNSVTGVVGIHGWCLDDDGVAAVDIYVDGVPAGEAIYGRQRSRVAVLFPDFPDAAAAGFFFQLNTAHYENGPHLVQPLCISNSGETEFVGSQTLLFTNTVHLLVPFGNIDFPNPNVVLYGNCDPFDPNRRYSIIEGWALDAGVEIGDRGVGWVELLVDGSVRANTRISCDFHPTLGFLTDCYGLVRQDLERVYPGLEDSPLAGWRFILDVGDLINRGFVRGAHVLTIRVGDISGQLANVDEIGVDFFCTGDFGNEGAFGRIAVPTRSTSLHGTVQVIGWALDLEGIAEIRVAVDGTFVGTAFQGFERPLVSLRYPGFPESDLPGFAFLLDTTELADGQHDIQVFVVDDTHDFDAPESPEDPSVTLIGEQRITVNNLITN